MGTMERTNRDLLMELINISQNKISMRFDIGLRTAFIRLRQGVSS